MIQPNLYIVRPNDTLEGIAAAYTGNRDRAAEIVSSNPHLPTRTFIVGGRPQRSLAELRYGQTIFLPVGWSRYPRVRMGQIVLPNFNPMRQSLGEACYPQPSEAFHPGVRFVVSQGVLPVDIAKAFTRDPNRWAELRSVNTDVPGGFSINRIRSNWGQCVFTKWFPGMQVRIPSAWPLPVKGSGLWKYIVRSNGVGVGANGDADPDLPPAEPSAGGTTYGPGNPHPSSGQTCTAGGMITNVKPYVYQVQSDDTPYLVAQRLTGSGSRWKELRQANYDDLDGFKIDVYGTCNWASWLNKKLKIPATWTDPPAGSNLWNLLIPTGQPGDGNGGGGGGGNGLGGEGVGAKDEGIIAKIPGWGWAVIGVGVGTGGLLVASHYISKRKEKRLLEGTATISRT